MEKKSLFIRNFIKKSMISQMIEYSEINKPKKEDNYDIYREIERAIQRKDIKTVRELSTVITSMWIENSKLAANLII
ncbi:MAG: hypothetical protein ACTSXK_16390 [Promethearchaeota archaeon]